MAIAVLVRLSKIGGATVPAVEQWSEKNRKSTEKIRPKCECTSPRSSHRYSTTLHAIGFLERNHHCGNDTIEGKVHAQILSMILCARTSPHFDLKECANSCFGYIYCRWRGSRNLAAQHVSRSYAQSVPNRMRTKSTMQASAVALLRPAQNRSHCLRQIESRSPSRQAETMWLQNIWKKQTAA